ncbi:unnamed protein product, partial [Arabidopsis halleri]
SLLSFDFFISRRWRRLDRKYSVTGGRNATSFSTVYAAISSLLQLLFHHFLLLLLLHDLKLCIVCSHRRHFVIIVQLYVN